MATLLRPSRVTDLLLIEDDPVAANLFVQRTRHFAPGEFAVTQSRTLESGLEEAAETEFGLAVIDLTLPDSNGIETCRRFHSEQPNIPFVVLTGVADSALAETLELAGANAAFLKEDCGGRELIDAVRSTVSPSRRHRPLVMKAVADARFRNAIVDKADGIVVIDQAGDVLLVSAGAESLLGRTAAEMTGSPLGISLTVGEPVRAQMVREESGHASAHEASGPVREFDVCKLRISEIEVWPFAHHWANKPVTVCAIRDVTNQSAEESRQRSILRIEEPLEVSSGIQAVCDDIAVRLGGLVRFNRFEAALWRPDLQRVEVIAELGMQAEGREVSSLVATDEAPGEFGSWLTAWSPGGYEIRVAVSAGCVEPGAHSERDSTILARCADVIASALASMRSSPVFVAGTSGAGNLPAAISGDTPLQEAA